MSRPVYNEGKVHVMGEKCSTCIFRPGNPMHLSPGRVKEMVDASIEDGGAITCHKTLPYAVPERDQQAVCRGFYDAHRDRVPALYVAEAMGVIEEVDP